MGGFPRQQSGRIAGGREATSPAAARLQSFPPDDVMMMSYMLLILEQEADL